MHRNRCRQRRPWKDRRWFGNRQRIRIRSRTAALGDKSARLDETVEGVAVDGEITQHRKRRRSKWLYRDHVAIVELAHVELTGRAPAWPVGYSVDGDTAGAANAFTAIVIKGDRLDVLFDQPFVDNVEHLQKGSIGGNIMRRVLFETSAFLGPALAPNA